MYPLRKAALLTLPFASLPPRSMAMGNITGAGEAIVIISISLIAWFALAIYTGVILQRLYGKRRYWLLIPAPVIIVGVCLYASAVAIIRQLPLSWNSTTQEGVAFYGGAAILLAVALMIDRAVDSPKLQKLIRLVFIPHLLIVLLWFDAFYVYWLFGLLDSLF